MPPEDKLVSFTDLNHLGEWEGWVYTYPFKSQQIITYNHPVYM